MTIRTTIGAAAAALAIALATPAFAATTVKVLLQDNTTDPAIKGMPMVVDKTTVPAGEISFDVTNQSKALVHEMLILPEPAGGPDALPYDATAQKVKEQESHKIDETDDMAPGLHKVVSITLAAGKYVLVCNQPGHFKMGMFKELVVTK